MDPDSIVGVYTKFAGLDLGRQEEVTGHPRLAKFSDRSKEVYLFLARHRNDSGDGEFVVPAMVAAPMLGFTFTEQIAVVRKVLKKHGKEGEDWKHLSIPLIFKHDLEVMFKIPGVPGGELKFVKPTRGNHKYPFLTLPFTRLLAIRGSTELCKELSELMIVMHDLLADKVEELQVHTYARIPRIQQTHPMWQKLRNDTGGPTKLMNDLLFKIGSTPLVISIHQYLNKISTGTSSAIARQEVPGMRKGETVRNVASRASLSVMQSIQDDFVIWLEDADDEGRVVTSDETMAQLIEFAGERQGRIDRVSKLPLLEHTKVIRKNGTISPAAYKRAALTSIDDPRPTHLLCETAHAKKKRLTPPKPVVNPFAKFGFLPIKKGVTV